jgi:hypothetical protein
MHTRSGRRSSLVGVLVGLTAIGCGRSGDDEGAVVRSSVSGPAGTVITGFVVLAGGAASIDDRSRVFGGDVGAAGTGVSTSLPTMVIGSEADFDRARVVVGQRTVLEDRAAIGALKANQVSAPRATFTSLSPFAAPPAVPALRTVTVGTTAVDVPVGQTRSLVAGRYAAIQVHGTLELTGGVYELASLFIDNDARVIARGRTIVRIAQGLRALDRVHIEPVAPLNAGDLRFTVVGVNSGTTNSVIAGNDAVVTGLLLAGKGVVIGHRLTAVGAIVAAGTATIGQDARLTWQVGFECNVDATCADSSTCTKDSCTDGQCVHPAVANGTSCNDGNACTATDSCQTGVCVGMSPKLCTALDACHVAGTCDPATGTCSNPTAPDGKSCDDGTICTTGDVCQAGSCTGVGLTCTTPATCDAIGVCAVTPVLDCVAENPDGSLVAAFGYLNGASGAVAIPVGSTNFLSPGDADRGQPTNFISGGQHFWVYVPLTGGSVTWRLGAGSATATPTSPRCPPFPTGGDDDTETNGDAVKFTTPADAHAPDPADVPAKTSNNLYPRVTLPNVPFVETAAAAAPEPDAEDDGEILALEDSHDRAVRSVEVVITNSTGELLSFVEGEFEGTGEVQPPSAIPPHSYGNLQSGSNGFAQGTGGHITYAFSGVQMKLTWNNPFIGGNDYTSTLTGAGSADFVVDRVGGSGNRATVFFHLRRTTQAKTNCPFGSHQWMVDSLRAAEEPLNGFDTAVGFVSTPAKNILGVGKWQDTGCFAPQVVGRVIARAHSTDRFFTIDVVLDEFDGALLADTGKAVRIEVAPFGVLGFKTNPAHRDIVDHGMPALGSRISFSGTVLIDHGSFLEVHPEDPIQPAKNCDAFLPGEPLPIRCNPALTSFTWNTGDAPVPMGRAENRACFLTGISGAFQSPEDEVHAVLDPATNNWFLTGKAGTSLDLVPIPGTFPVAPTNAEASAILGMTVVNVIPLLFGQYLAEAQVPHSLRAQARCITTAAVFPEATWTQGDAPVLLGTTSAERGCFLTRVAGHFEGGGEEVRIVEILTGPQTLQGSSAQAGVSASARCAASHQISFPGIWNQGTPPTALGFLNTYPGCFLIEVGGRFEGGGERVEIRADTNPSGNVFWEITGTSAQQSVHGVGECMKP